MSNAAVIKPEERKKQIANKGKSFKQLHITKMIWHACKNIVNIPRISLVFCPSLFRRPSRALSPDWPT